MKITTPILFLFSMCISTWAYGNFTTLKSPIDTSVFTVSRKQNAVGISAGFMFPHAHLLKPGSGTFFKNNANTGVAGSICFEGVFSKIWGFTTFLQYSHQPFVQKWNTFSKTDAMDNVGLFVGPGLWFGSPKVMVQLNTLGGVMLNKNLEIKYADDSSATISFFEQPKFAYRFDVNLRTKITGGIGIKTGVAYQYYHPDARVNNVYNPLNAGNMYYYISLLAIIKNDFER